MTDNYTVTELPIESITVDSPTLTLEPMETESERHARLIETANRREVTDKPLAQQGLRSYRYKGRYGWIMIGARDTAHALNEAQRSTNDKVTVDKLEVFIRGLYIPAKY